MVDLIVNVEDFKSSFEYERGGISKYNFKSLFFKGLKFEIDFIYFENNCVTSTEFPKLPIEYFIFKEYERKYECYPFIDFIIPILLKDLQISSFLVSKDYDVVLLKRTIKEKNYFSLEYYYEIISLVFTKFSKNFILSLEHYVIKKRKIINEDSYTYFYYSHKKNEDKKVSDENLQFFKNRINYKVFKLEFSAKILIKQSDYTCNLEKIMVEHLYYYDEKSLRAQLLKFLDEKYNLRSELPNRIDFIISCLVSMIIPNKDVSLQNDE